MTPQEALDLLNTNVANMPGTREAHDKIRMAVMILQQVVNQATPDQPLPNGDAGEVSAEQPGNASGPTADADAPAE